MSRRRQARGFTLVEIMVSLVAGLFIAMAVIALSKTATNTFHEEVRNATVEASLRTASERLRNDLVRVAFMGTGNAQLDNKLARPSTGATLGMRYANMTNLQGLRITYQGSTSSGDAILNLNSLSPDRVDITGNLTTDDSYRMQWVTSDIAVGAGACGGPQLQMRPGGDPALARLIGGVDAAGNAIQPTATADALVRAAFTPQNGVDFLARAVDARGCPHYVQICSSGFDGTYVYVNVRPSSADQGLLTTFQTGDFCGGAVMEEFNVSPLTRVRWEIMPSSDARISAAAAAAIQPDPDIEAPANKHVLVRSMYAADGTTIVNAPEIIAEYAVDLKFGTVYVPAGASTVTIADMDPASSAADQSTPLASTTNATSLSPHRVRSVRYRVSVRTALPDRRTNLSIFSSPTPLNQPYIVRYCTVNAALATCKTWARVRTIVSETALTNHARFSY
jgi:type II secretory pathway pseudopilin PulG